MSRYPQAGAPESLSADSVGAPHLILLPGTGGTVSRDYALLMERMPEEMQVTGFDYAIDPGATFDSMVAEVVAVIDQIANESVVLVGYSLSAAIAVGVAVERPDRVASLILIAGFSEGKDPRLINEFREWQRLLEANRAEFARHVLMVGHRRSIADSLGEKEISQRIVSHLETADFDQTAVQVAIDLEVSLGSSPRLIKNSVLVVGCSEDRIVPEAVTRELASRFPRGKYASLCSGHFVLAERPEELTTLMLEHLRQLGKLASSNRNSTPVGSEEMPERYPTSSPMERKLGE